MLTESTDGRRIKGAETRQSILRCAVTCIASSGLSNTTLDKIAALAGVSRGLVVFHFKSKIGMFREVLDYLGVEYGEGWEATMKLKDCSAIEKLFLLMEYDVRFARDHPNYISAWHAFWGEAKGNELYHELSVPRDHQYGEDIRSLLSILIEEGGYDSTELDSIYKALFSMLFGIWLESHTYPEANDYEMGTKAVRIFLSKMFPNHTVAEAVTGDIK